MNIFGDFYDNLAGEKSKRYIRELDKAENEYELPRDIRNKIREEGVRTRLPWLYLLLVLIGLRLVLGLVTLQVVSGLEFSQKVQQTRLQTVYLAAVRGIILDSKGKPLVENMPSFNLGIIPADLPKSKIEREQVLSKVASYIQISSEEIEKSLANKEGTLEPIILREDIPREEALVLEEKLLGQKGVSLFISTHRQYQKIVGLSHILGYTGRMTEEDIKKHPDYLPTEILGKSGIEASYEEDLRGLPGNEKLEITPLGEVRSVLERRDPENGKNIQLYLDSELQQHVADALKAGMEKSQAQAGAAIVMDVNSGGILASVSLPDFDDNLFFKSGEGSEIKKLFEDKNAPLLNRVIAGQYPSGSTVKPFIAAAALNEHIVSDKFRLITPPYIEVGQWKFLDWKPHGSADIRQAIAESNNIFFYALGGGYDKVQGLGIDRIKAYLEKFGFGLPTGVDLPGEAKGLIPDPEWKKKTKNEAWYIGDTYNLSIGQGDFLVTPLQLVRGIAAIANGGKLLQPYYVSTILDGENHPLKTFGYRVVSENFITSENLRIVREGMRQAVESGTARPLQSVAVAVAAKTGTAQFSNIDKEKTHAWTVAFAPFDNPQIAVVVLVEGGGESFEVALPVVKEILEFRFGKKE